MASSMLFLILLSPWRSSFFFFFFNDTATTEIYTLSLHDALPIWRNGRRARLKIWYPKGCVGSSPTFGTPREIDRKSTRLNSSHLVISYAVFCLKKKKNHPADTPSLLCT